MYKAYAAALTLTLVGCATTTSETNKTNMVTNFDRRGVKVEWSCEKTSKSCKNPQIVSIEANGYNPVCRAQTPACVDTAFKIAETKAKAALARFVSNEIKTSSVVKTLSNTLAKTSSSTEGKVELRESEPITTDLDSSDVATTVVTTISSQSEVILRGAGSINETLTNGTAAVTVRWDAQTSNALNLLNSQHFSAK